MSTPHLSANPGEIAPLVLMPGDPRRARRIAATFFDDARLVTEVRGIEGWTGTYRGTPISAVASGMGSPSITIYATELYRFYDVRRIIRVGTAGAIAEDLSLGEVVIGSAAHTDSALAQRVPGVHFSHAPSFGLLAAAVQAAREAGVTPRVGPIFSSDVFYSSRPDTIDALAAHGTLAVEMEAAALYGVAAEHGREALTLATITDHLRREENMTAEERETCFQQMTGWAIAALLS